MGYIVSPKSFFFGHDSFRGIILSQFTLMQNGYVTGLGLSVGTEEASQIENLI
jgi:hypothetical protein